MLASVLFFLILGFGLAITDLAVNKLISNEEEIKIFRVDKKSHGYIINIMNTKIRLPLYSKL